MRWFQARTSEARRIDPHPLSIAFLTLPAMIAVLIAQRPWFAIAALACCLFLSLTRGYRFAASFTPSITLMLLILWFGMGLWLPQEAATAGALRIVAMSVLLVIPFAFVNWDVLAESLIDRFRVPYRVVDALFLGERFTSLMRADLRTAKNIARLRARGDLGRYLRLRLGAMLPVLVASFRHSDELAISLDARGFGAHPRRTVRQSRPITTYDLVVLAVVWGASVLAAVLLERI